MAVIIGTKQLSSKAPYVMLDNVSYSAYQDGNNVVYTVTVQMRTNSNNGYYDWGWYYNMWVNGTQIVSNGTIKGRTRLNVIGKNIYQSSASITLPLGSSINVTVELWSAESPTYTHYSNFGTYQNDGGATPAFIVAPSLSSLSVTNVGDTYFNASFDVNNNGGQGTDFYIDVALNNFSGVVATRTSSGQFTGLSAGRQYYVRGNAANSAGRIYTNVVAVTTAYYVPSAPTSLSCTKTVINNTGILTWNYPSYVGSNGVVGYRIRIYKNNSLLSTINADLSSYYEYTFSERDWSEGDIFKFDVCAYSVRWDGTKMYGTVQTSSNYSVDSDKYVYLLINSSNPNDFVKVDLNLLVNSDNPNNFVEVKKANFGLNINNQWIGF